MMTDRVAFLISSASFLQQLKEGRKGREWGRGEPFDAKVLWGGGGGDRLLIPPKRYYETVTLFVVSFLVQFGGDVRHPSPPRNQTTP